MTTKQNQQAVYRLEELAQARATSGRAYLEFIRIPALTTGLYVLPAGGTDTQQPHAEDEVYYVVAGRGQVQVGEESYPVQAGSVVLVEANVAHHFFNIEEELQLLVFFAPAEYTNTGKPL